MKLTFVLIVVGVKIIETEAYYSYKKRQINPNLVRTHGGFPGFHNVTRNVDARQFDIEELLTSHAKMKGLANAIVFTCRSENARIKMLRVLSSAGLSAILVEMGSSQAETALYMAGCEMKPILVAMDLDCGDDAAAILEMASNMSLFTERMSWLATSSDLLRSARLLAATNLNTDSDFVLVTLSPSAPECWVSFDVYNQGFRYFGKFNMTFRSIFLSKHLNINARNSKHTTNNLKIITPQPLIIDPSENVSKEILAAKVAKIHDQVEKICSVIVDNENMLLDEIEDVKIAEHAVHYNNGWWMFLSGTWIRRRWNVQNITLIHAQVSVAKFRGTFEDFISTPYDHHIETMHRFNYVLFRHVADMIGFRLQPMRVRSWGDVRNGSATGGLLGALQTGAADVSTTPIRLRSDRVGIGHNTVICYVVKIGVLFKQPQHEQTSLAVFSRPLAAAVWWSVAALAVCIGVLYLVAVQFENRQLGADENSVEATWSNAVLFIVCILIQQGPERSPRLCSGRTVTVSMLMLGLMLYQFYSASLVGSLLSPPPKLIRSLQDLIEGEFRVGLEEQPYERDFLRERSRYKYGEELYRKKLEPFGGDVFMSAQEGMRKVRLGGFAFQVDTATAYRIMEDWSDDEICHVDELLLYPILNVPTRVRRGLPFYQHILTGYQRVAERGVRARELRTWVTPRPQCARRGAALRPVGLQALPALCALAVAGLIAIVVLGAELFVHKIYTRAVEFRL